MNESENSKSNNSNFTNESKNKIKNKNKKQKINKNRNSNKNGNKKTNKKISDSSSEEIKKEKHKKEFVLMPINLLAKNDYLSNSIGMISKLKANETKTKTKKKTKPTTKQKKFKLHSIIYLIINTFDHWNSNSKRKTTNFLRKKGFSKLQLLIKQTLQDTEDLVRYGIPKFEIEIDRINSKFYKKGRIELNNQNLILKLNQSSNKSKNAYLLKEPLSELTGSKKFELGFNAGKLNIISLQLKNRNAHYKIKFQSMKESIRAVTTMIYFINAMDETTRHTINLLPIGFNPRKVVANNEKVFKKSVQKDHATANGTLEEIFKVIFFNGFS